MPAPLSSLVPAWHHAIPQHPSAMPFRALLVSFLVSVGLAGEPPVIRVTETAPPSTARATGPSLTRAPDGTVWLTWLESLETPPNAIALRCATFDPAAGAWSAPRTIASGDDWLANRADFPAVTIGRDGAATVVWYVENPIRAGADDHDAHGPGYHARISRTTDSGKTWSRGVPLTRESDSVEFVSLATLADGRVLAVWLDGRARRAGGKAQQLFGRVLGSDQPDTLIDPSVCDCCQTDLATFPDGTALVAYRGRTDREVRDIRLARFRGGAWDEPRAVSRDEWEINGCPVNGPQVASQGGRVAVAWFTAAGGEPRVLASFSPDAGERFLAPLRIDRSSPGGRVDTLLLRDGALLVTWAETDGSVWLRRVSPAFAADDAFPLASAGAAHARGFPRVALLRDYAGGDAPAEFLVVFTGGATGDRLHALRVTVPEGALLAAENDCDCAPSPEQLQGHPFRGTVAETPAASGGSIVRVTHAEMPGILAAGTHVFRVAPQVAGTLAHGRQFLGRIVERDGEWWLYDVRLLGAPPPAP